MMVIAVAMKVCQPHVPDKSSDDSNGDMIVVMMVVTAVSMRGVSPLHQTNPFMKVVMIVVTMVVTVVAMTVIRW